MQLLRILAVLGAVTTVGCGGGGQSQGAGRPGGSATVTLDGSSTVFPISEAVAEEFQKAERRRARHRRHLGHRRRLQEVLPRRDRHQRRLAADQATEDRRRARPAASTYIELPVAYDGLAVVVNPKNDLGRPPHRRGAEDDLGARGAGQGHAAGARSARAGPDRELHLFGAGVDSGTYDYFTEAIVGKSTRPAAATSPRAKTTTCSCRASRSDDWRLGFFGLAYYDENQDKLKLVPVDDGKDDNGNGPIAPSVDDREGRHLPAAVAPDLHLRVDKAAPGARRCSSSSTST